MKLILLLLLLSASNMVVAAETTAGSSGGIYGGTSGGFSGGQGGISGGNSGSKDWDQTETDNKLNNFDSICSENYEFNTSNVKPLKNGNCKVCGKEGEWFNSPCEKLYGAVNPIKSKSGSTSGGQQSTKNDNSKE